MSGVTPLRPNLMDAKSLGDRGLRRHGPTSVALTPRNCVARGPRVGAPRRSECYAFVAPPRMWGRGVRNAVCPTSSATC
jgi:hypothetical protein